MLPNTINKAVFIFFVMLLSLQSAAMNIILFGTIRDADTKEPLSYATVQIYSLKTGTIANIDGEFQLLIEAEDTESIQLDFSHVGYQTLSLGYKEVVEAKGIVELQKQPYLLDEVSIIPKDYQIVELGIKNRKPKGRQFANVFGGNKGNLIRNTRQEDAWFKSVSYYLHPIGQFTCPFRIRIYSVGEHGEPGKDLINQNIIAYPEESGWFTINISEYHIPFPKEGAFVMMEWINVGQEYFFEVDDKRYYGQALGAVSIKGDITLWGNTLGSEWVPYHFNNNGRYIHAMIRAKIAYGKR